MRVRFVITAIALSTLILSITFFSVYFATAIRTNIQINEKLSRALDQGLSSAEDMDDKDCMLVLYSNGVYNFKRNEQYTDEEQKGIVLAMVVSIRKSFKYGGHTFQYSLKNYGNDTILYAVYDCTAERITLNKLLIIISIGLSATIVIVGFFAWGLSKSNVKPVVEALDKQKALIANASHELKTPLTIINTQLELISDEALTDNQKKWIGGVNEQTRRMETLIKEMLELSKLEANKELSLGDVNISDLFESTILSLEAPCFEKEISLESDIQPNVIINSDKEKVEKLFVILLDNATKYTPTGGSIKVALKTRKSWALFSVMNTGDGIPKEKLDKVFDRFYKTEESRTGESNSFGLGLSIAKSLVEALHGVIRCESEVNEYTKFSVALPLPKKRAFDKSEREVRA